MNSKKRDAAYELGKNPDRFKELQYWKAKAILETPGEKSHYIRRALIERYILEHYSVSVCPDDLLVGRMTTDFIANSEQQKELDLAELITKNAGVLAGTEPASTNHRAVDYEKLLKVGVKGLLQEIRQADSQIDYTTPDAAEKRFVYEAMTISLNGLLSFAERIREKLRKLCVSASDEHRDSYLRLLNNLERVPYEPCSHFYEAVQCMWLIQFSLNLLGDTSLSGRIDQYLYPYYQADIESGCLAKEDAFSIIEELYLKHNELYDAWPASVMIGGRDKTGKLVFNDLTWMCVKAIKTTGLINPSVSICYTDEMPDDFLMECVSILADGYTRPAFFNDKIVTKGLLDIGCQPEDAFQYMHSTCVEITPVASSNILIATPYINLCKAFEFILYEKEKKYVIGPLTNVGPGWGGDVEEVHLSEDIVFSLDDIHTFDDFMSLAKLVFSKIIGAHVRSALELADQRRRYNSSPLSSTLLNDCIARGKDCGAGGARYNYCYPCFPGVVNAIDSLAAIRQVVFIEKLLTLRDLATLCKTNFFGHEDIRQYLLNRCPKFGNNNHDVDSIGRELYDFISQELRKYCVFTGEGCYPSYFAYIVHGLFGNLTDATPDGRLRGTAMSEHLGAVSGMDKHGPIAVLRSISKLDHTKGIGGIATNFRFSKSFLSTENGKRALVSFIRAFMQSNCFEIQFNVVSTEDLLAAQANPQDYQTLLVRVAGYSDYFVNLPENIQNEIIARTEHSNTEW